MQASLSSGKRNKAKGQHADRRSSAFMQLPLCLRQREGLGNHSVVVMALFIPHSEAHSTSNSTAPALPRELTAQEQQHGQRAQPGSRQHRAEPYSGQDRSWYPLQQGRTAGRTGAAQTKASGGSQRGRSGSCPQPRSEGTGTAASRRHCSLPQCRSPRPTARGRGSERTGHRGAASTGQEALPQPRGRPPEALRGRAW